MKKIILILLIVSSFASAQESTPNPRKNEVRVDVLQAILSSKASISYERFLDSDFSYGINVNFTNSSKVRNDFEEGNTNNLPKYEFNPYVRYALSKGKKTIISQRFLVRIMEANSKKLYTKLIKI